MHTLLCLIIAVLTTVGCQKEKGAELPELDLLSYGMPIVIKAPENALIEKMDLVVSTDITVKKGDFFLQIFESNASSRDIEAIKSRLLGEAQGNRYFQKVVHEEPDGFIYESAIDSSYVTYDFRRVRIQGDKEYVFQTGLRGQFTFDQVELMFAAVK